MTHLNHRIRLSSIGYNSRESLWDSSDLRYKQQIKPYTKYDISSFIDKSKIADSKAELELTDNLLKQRILLNGFSINPPGADNWSGYGVPGISSAVVFHNDIRSKLFKKQLATNILRVSLFHLENVAMNTEDFIEYLQTMNMFKEGPRQKNMHLSLSEEKFKGANCVRFALNAEDDNVPGMGSKHFLISALGMECIHPKSPGVHVSIVFTQRSIKGKNVKSYKSIANDFIQGVEFTEYK